MDQYRRRPPMEGFSRPGSLGGEAFDDDEVEGHIMTDQDRDPAGDGISRGPKADDDTEGHGFSRAPKADDDTEGHGFSRAPKADNDDDTEGHAVRKMLTDDDDDTEGHTTTKRS